REHRPADRDRRGPARHRQVPPHPGSPGGAGGESVPDGAGGRGVRTGAAASPLGAEHVVGPEGEPGAAGSGAGGGGGRGRGGGGGRRWGGGGVFGWKPTGR